MRFKHIATLATVGLLLTGCTKGLNGTWTSVGNTDGAFEVANVTFADDGTYTAEVNYNDQTRGDSGQWQLVDGTLTLEGHANRVYKVAIDGDEMTMTNPETGNSVILERD